MSYLIQAHQCYRTSLSYAKASGDSLQISTAYKGLGTYWLAKGKTARALRYISEADKYYSLHQDQEFNARIETLGLTSPQIADRMCLSLPTIKWYRKRLLEKFDVSNTAELISKAKEQGVL
ncbi:MAG: helix-turn-helix transcriptional regulator [Bacteroidales bacterium]|nr:helix-turn-helix transcriptional regulator [Bacteroidales bacterium]